MSPTTPVGSSSLGTRSPSHDLAHSEDEELDGFSLPRAALRELVEDVEFNFDPRTSPSFSGSSLSTGRQVRILAEPHLINSTSSGASIASEPEESIRLNIEEVGDVAERVNTVFFNLLANKKGDYYEAAEQDQQTLDEVFAAVKGHCQNQESGAEIQRFEIHWSKGLVKYRIEGREVIRSFDEINESASEEVKALIAEGEQAIVRVNHGRSVRAKEFSPTGKGTQGGQQALVRPSYLASELLPTSLGSVTNTKVIEMLPSLSGADAAARSTQVSAAMSRMGAAEKMIGKIKEVAIQKRDALQGDIADLEQQKNADGADVADLSRQIEAKNRDLDVIRQRLGLLDGIDGFALNAALAAYPGLNASPQEVLRAAGSVYQQIEQISERLRLQKNEELSSRTWVPDLPLIGRLRNEVNLNGSSYAKDVGGLLLSGRAPAEGRDLYFDYCRQLGISPKDDRLEDFIIRKVFRPVDQNPLDTELFRDIQDATLKDELEQALVDGVREAQELLAQTIDLTAQADDAARIAEFRRLAGLE